MDCTPKEYVASKTTISERIIAIDSLIANLLLETIETVTNSGVVSLSMDDGQMKVNTGFRSMSEVTDGIRGFERIKQMYINQYQGRGMVLRGRANY